MKNALLFSSKVPKILKVLITTLAILTLGACTPEDRGVTSGDTRLMIQNKNKQKKGEFFQVGPFAMTSVMSDQLLEAIEVVQVARGKQDKSFYTVTDLGSTESGGQVVGLSADLKDHAFTTSQGDFVMSFKKNWEVIIAAPGHEYLYAAKSEKAEQSVKKLNMVDGKGTLGSFRETESFLALKNPSDRPEIVILGLTSKGSLDGSNSGLSTSENFEILITASLDRAAFEAGEIKILETGAQTSFIKAGGKKPFLIKTSSQELTLHAEAFCNSLTGAITIESDKNKKQLVLTAENAAVSGTGWQSSLATCGTRPTVDLSRMLIK